MSTILVPSRRGFLGLLAAAAVAPAIIRTPGLLMPIKPSLVPARVTILTPAMIAKEFARQLWNNGSRSITDPVLKADLIQSHVDMIDAPTSENIRIAASIMSSRAKTIALAPMLPVGALAAAYETYEGVSVRYLADYNVREDMIVHRFDVLHT